MTFVQLDDAAGPGSDSCRELAYEPDDCVDPVGDDLHTGGIGQEEPCTGVGRVDSSGTWMAGLERTQNRVVAEASRFPEAGDVPP